MTSALTLRSLLGHAHRLADRWATASHERALANARGGAVACAQALVDRAEVEAFLARWYDEAAGQAEAVSR